MKKLFLLLTITLFTASFGLAGCSVADLEESIAEQVEEEVEEVQEQVEEAEAETSEEVTEEEAKDYTDLYLDVDLEDIDGNTYNLAELGDKAVIKVWASWCSVCLSGLDEYDELSSNQEDGLVLSIISPNLYGEVSKEEFIDWYSDLGYENIIILFDDEGEVVQELGITGFPTYIFFNSDGAFAGGAVGHQANSKLSEFLATLP